MLYFMNISNAYNYDSIEIEFLMTIVEGKLESLHNMQFFP